MEHKTDLLEILSYVDPAMLDYQEWCSVGMALKTEGYSVGDWDDWSRRDPARYHAGDCEKKWDSFHGGGASPVTGGTIVQLAKDQGWSPSTGGHEIGWDDEIGGDDLKVIDSTWLEAREVQPPDQWDPAGQLITYMETLFEAAETVGYVTESWQKDDKYLPTKGDFSRTAGQLIEELSKCGGDIGKVLGDYKPEAGAWIRFNPLDGHGVKNENVTDYRYALVESDTMPIDQQNAIIRELELPVACLVHSGGKSLHAIVRIEAQSYDEYRKRVDYLYTVLKKNGLSVDTQNKNPSRLSRMPGVTRKGNKQFLVDTNIGKESWAEWKEWIEGINDDLPDFQNISTVRGNRPPLAPELIEGVLRMGHKMLISGASKSSKSFALIELAIAIAEGKKWIGLQCRQGRVLYVNLELDANSCWNRILDVYDALGYPGGDNLDVWNLRGKSVPMDKLAPKLIRRAQKKDYIAIIIDPIYKIITGDENSADQMAAFCNQFDKVCTDLRCAVIYCHHHSKGAQGGKKSMDRASGSGVFARDPDALLDIVELELTDELRKQTEDRAEAEAYLRWIRKYVPDLEREVSQDDALSAARMRQIIQEASLPVWRMDAAQRAADEARNAARNYTALRVESTLREFPKHPTINIWFKYPIHVLDDSGALGDIQPETELSPYQKFAEARKKHNAAYKEELYDKFVIAFEGAVGEGCAAKMQDIAEQLEIDSKTIGGWFGTGKKARKDLKQEFEKYTGDDTYMYIRRKGKGKGCDT